jgi:hypothetical protein
MKDIDIAINSFVNKCRVLVRADGRDKLGYDLEIGGGRKYTKIIMNTGNQRMVWAFINRTNGDVFKPANWKAPAKHPRGNLYDEEDGMKFIQWTGPMYMNNEIRKYNGRE